MKIIGILAILFSFFACSESVVSPDEPDVVAHESKDYRGTYTSISSSYYLLPAKDLDYYNIFAYKWDGSVSLNGDTVSALIHYRVDDGLVISGSNVLPRDSIDYFLNFDPYIHSPISKDDNSNDFAHYDTIIYDSKEVYKHNFTAIFKSDTFTVNLTAPIVSIKAGIETGIDLQVDPYFHLFSKLTLKEDMSVVGSGIQGEFAFEITDGSWKAENDSITIHDKYQDYVFSDNTNNQIKLKRDVINIGFFRDLGITDSCKMYNSLIMEKK